KGRVFSSPVQHFVCDNQLFPRERAFFAIALFIAGFTVRGCASAGRSVSGDSGVVQWFSVDATRPAPCTIRHAFFCTGHVAGSFKFSENSLQFVPADPTFSLQSSDTYDPIRWIAQKLREHTQGLQLQSGVAYGRVRHCSEGVLQIGLYDIHDAFLIPKHQASSRSSTTKPRPRSACVNGASHAALGPATHVLMLCLDQLDLVSPSAKAWCFG